MVILSANIIINPEFEALKKELQNARNRYTELVEEYALLINVVGKNLEDEYSIKIGKKEYELFSCRVEILRIKREIELFQAARNHGRTISDEEVNRVIAKEFSEYQEKLNKLQEKLRNAKERFLAPNLPEKEDKAIKKLYHDLVRKLHPDLNPDLPAEAAVLWERVQFAYKYCCFDELFLLSDMVDELLRGKTDFVESLSSMEQISNELVKINQKTSDLKKKIADTRSSVPFTYEELLSNPAKILHMRKELDKQIEHCKKYIAELKAIREKF